MWMFFNDSQVLRCDYFQEIHTARRIAWRCDLLTTRKKEVINARTRSKSERKTQKNEINERTNEQIKLIRFKSLMEFCIKVLMFILSIII